jgi:hypothetical protein
MRVLTLVSGPEAVGDAVRLTGEIRSFNAELDFRLRFLHIGIEESYAAAPAAKAELERQLARAQVHAVADAEPLRAAASLALLLARQRPDLMVITGQGVLLEPGLAAAETTETRVGFFGASRGSAEDALDLGESPLAAVNLMSGVAGEIS